MRIILLLLCLALAGCGNQGVHGSAIAGGYLYLETSQENNSIVSPLQNGKDVYGHIVDYKSNGDFIVVCQAPDYYSYKMAIVDKLLGSDKSANSLSAEALEKKANNILQSDSSYKKVFLRKVNYWIMDIRNKIEYGPLSKEKYWATRSRLNIPADILCLKKP
jgi:hypothetical protein